MRRSVMAAALETRYPAGQKRGRSVRRIGLIGFGFVGAGLYQALRGGAQGLEVAFVHNRSGGRLEGVPSALILDDLRDFARFTPDLIVECAHPSITMAHGAAFLERAD